MSLATSWRAVRRITRLALCSAAAVAVFFALVFSAIWLNVLLTGAFLRKAELFLLSAVEIAYATTAVLSFFGATVLGLFWLRGRRAGKSQPLIVQWLLLCGSLCFGLVLAEVTIAAWRHHQLTRTPMPVGGFGPNEEADATWRIPARLVFPDLPTRFPDPPGDPIVYIAVLGESSAVGVPFEKWLSVGKIVAWQLEQAIPARPVRLTVLARSGDTLEVQHQVLADLNRRPDLLIVYCGHNEFSSRLYWRRDRRYYLDLDQPARIKSRFERLEQLSAVCRLIREESNKCLISIPPSRFNHRDLVDLPAHTRVEYAALFADFRRVWKRSSPMPTILARWLC